MKKFILLSFVLTYVIMSMIPIISALPPSGYTLVKADEFDGPSLDPMWQPHYLKHRKNTDAEAAARYSFSNGCIVLRIDEDTPIYLDNMRVSSIQTGEKTDLHKTGVRSVSTFEGYKKQYGYFEVRAKHQRGSGHHVAFWMIGTQPYGQTQTAEIDITEHAGGNVYSTKLGNLVPWGDSAMNPQDSGDSFNLGNDLTANFNVYGMEWQPNSLKFYANDTLYKTLNRAPTYPMYILLGVYQGSNWTGTVDPSIPYPKTYTVDYLRIYDNTGGYPSPTPTPTPGYGIADGIYKIKSKQYNKYMDTELDYVVILENGSNYDDQQWEVTNNGNGYYLIKNVRSGRYYLDSDEVYVLWNDGYTGDDAQWAIESAGDGSYRLRNKKVGREYIYGTSDNRLKWNTGTIGEDTKWIFEGIN